VDKSSFKIYGITLAIGLVLWFCHHCFLILNAYWSI
jgi:hypothetical protein